ncbi:Ycf20-like protein [Striga hermonthica]|uniref:Ycf20-like protein n=1 Tax=Striga hermonthica TaxID=68872 RepID=A0A9N7R713_STRHE|nr:Ycf20-like protein [Striga hermonthica]
MRDAISTPTRRDAVIVREKIPDQGETIGSGRWCGLKTVCLAPLVMYLMACEMDIITTKALSLVANEGSMRWGVFSRDYCGLKNPYAQNLYRPAPKLDLTCHRKRRAWRLSFSLNTEGLAANNEQDNNNNPDEDASSSGLLGATRLGRIVTAGGKQLLSKLNSTRKNFPMKVFLLLLGFYTANALATILGQTGDWDVLVAGIVVAAIEGIGMLMYKKSLMAGRLQSLVVMVNYWKAGVCLGLFVDAFKLGS